MDEVVSFIDHFQNLGTIDIFTNGCCYWFAKILEERFEGSIMYNPVDNHFATLIDTHLYDILGEIPGDIRIDDNWYFWDEYEKLDPLETGRIYKYCINKTE